MKEDKTLDTLHKKYVCIIRTNTLLKQTHDLTFDLHIIWPSQQLTSVILENKVVT